MLIDQEALGKGLELLRAEDFYHPRHRLVFGALVRMFDRAEPVDLVTLSEDLREQGELDKAGGLKYLAELGDMLTAANLEYHVSIVRDRSQRRRLQAVATETAKDVLGKDPLADVLDRAETRIMGIRDEKETQGPVKLRQGLMPALDRIDEIHRTAGGITGIPTGFYDLDDMTGGLQRGDLVILAARPSMGKTALTTGIALNAAMAGHGVGTWSLEMSQTQVIHRLLCHEGQINLLALLRGRLTDDEHVRLAQAAGHIQALPIAIDDAMGLTAATLRARARRIKLDWPDLGLLVVDYLQLMAGGDDAENRNHEISQISRALKGIAKELDVAVLALSQLSRACEQRSDKRPVLSDLRDSGSLEQDADVVLMLYRAEQYLSLREAMDKGIVGDAELLVRKQRNGPTGTIDLFFRRECARFENAAREERAA